ncbi:hypothetical protein EI42_00924 [Thermosporothrix hazakensis]|jgi:hypothetical protein|uniref:Uncharacterized protein n=2 Tax=Thermosporothrix TaxID=768650 RepID=A0A326UWM8_THEHA|nr:hypothetical protein [Thermosporothrix hazakensis]PZW36743.1 hypothetical protein EI42_00924 [Thermosporothrix hazakensis]BBH89211.1 hypothetical protein KTC_39620 [Thermosporothrix sp. COM3]GCE47393.1 hypothetical protein KTH_22620 [Thermosporothrix hazakensis]
MHNLPYQPGDSEQPEQTLHTSETDQTETTQLALYKEHTQLKALLDSGFSWGEAIRLIDMKEGFYSNPEVRQRMEEDSHIQFARWLYEQGELNEN